MSNPGKWDHTAITRIHIVGAGAWGQTIALLCARNRLDVTLIARTETSANRLEDARRHLHDVSPVRPPERVTIEHLDRHSLETAEAVVMAVPVQSLHDVLAQIGPSLVGRAILSAAKGLETDSLLRPSEVIGHALHGDCSLAVVSGPNLSAEIAAGKPASTVVASDDPRLARLLAATMHSGRFRTYLSADVAGVELGGALKNIIAIGAGIADGLDAGDNAKAALVTRGLAEIARLGVACGADPLTFAGLSGMGDLIATCASPLSRNHQVGVGLAQGRRLEEIQQNLVGTAEGVATTRAAVQLAASKGVEMPIATQMHRVLFDGVSPTDAITRLMERDLGPEVR